METSKYIHNKSDRGENTLTIYLDFKKAFDTVNHVLLIRKLSRSGIGPKALNLLMNYLNNRTQVTMVKGLNSEERNLTTDVPQGSTRPDALSSVHK